jgi:hypothetical protein
MRRNIEVLILVVLAALSVMAVTAVGAQATGEFRVEGKALAEGEEAELEATGGASKLSVPALKLTIECTSVLLKAKVKNVKIGAAKLAHAEHHALRHTCFPIGWEACSIYPTEEDLAKGTNAGLLLSSTLRLSFLFGNFIHYLLFSVSERFFFGGVFCTLPKEAKVTGETAVKFGNAKTEAVEHTMEDITATEEKEIEAKGLFFNGEPAEISGDTTSPKLVGKFAGKKYSLN